jgi:hypothetical protein
MQSRQLQVTATYKGIDQNGNHMLADCEIRGEKRTYIKRDHHYVNGIMGNFPIGVPVDAKIKFFASPLFRHGGARLTDCREVEVI